MFDHKRIIFVTADVGHHGEILTKIIYSWFNKSKDDVIIQDKHLKFTKISMSSYGKLFLYSMLFGQHNLDSLLNNALAVRLKSLKDNPDNGGFMNTTWPVATTVHLRKEFDMIKQINEVDSSVLHTFTPYKTINDADLSYLTSRNEFYTGIYEPNTKLVDTRANTLYNINCYTEINNRTDVSLISDIVNGTTETIDELEEIFQQGPATSRNRLQSWLKMAHEVYKQHYER